MTGVASYGYKVVSKVPSIPSTLIIRLGTADDFVEEMQELGFRYRRALEDVAPLDHSTVVGTPTACYACDKSLKNARGKTVKDAVLDYDQFTGTFRGHACERCNLQMRNPREIVVNMHNAESFDNHFVVQASRPQTRTSLSTSHASSSPRAFLKQSASRTSLRLTRSLPKHPI